MTELKDEFGPINLVITDEVVSDGGYEIQYRDKNDNIEDIDTVPPTFYREQYWKGRIRNKVKKVVEEKGTQDGFDFDKEWSKLKKEWVGHFRVEEEEKKKGGKTEESEYQWDEEYLEEEAEKWLKSPELLSFIDRCIHHHLTGETKNALLVFLTYLTALTDEPNNLRPTGESSIGKSFLVTRVARLLPKDMKIVRESFSKMAPWNKAKPVPDKDNYREWNLLGKVIIILEEENSEEFLKQFRSVLSHDEEVVSYEVTDTEGDSRDTLVVNMRGWPTYIGLQVGGKLDEQEETRAMSLTPDSGSEKYSKAQWFDARKKETPWLEGVRMRDTEIAKKLVEKLDRYHVLIPHREKIQKYFPSRRRRHMRDWKQFESLVEAVTVLHQYQRPTLEVDGEEYKLAHPDDIAVAIKIAENALAETLANLDAKARKFWKHLSQFERIAGYSGLQNQYRKCFNGESISRATLKNKYVEVLNDKNLLDVNPGSGRNPNLFYPSGQLPSHDEKMDKLAEVAYDRNLKGTTFELLLSDGLGPQDTAKIRNCEEVMGENPVQIESLETCEDFWMNIGRIPSILRENRQLLETGYDADYGKKKKKVEDEKEAPELSEDSDVPELKTDSEESKEEDPPELSGNFVEIGEGSEEETPSRQELDSVDRVLEKNVGTTPEKIADTIAMPVNRVKACLKGLRDEGLAKNKPNKIEDEMLWFKDGE